MNTISVANATVILMWVLVPTDEILSFASPNHMDVVNVENAGAVFHKRKYPKLRRPDAAYSLRLLHLSGFARKDIPVPPATCGIPAAPLWAIPDKYSDARRGIRE
jgi:hypothetical protein